MGDSRKAEKGVLKLVRPGRLVEIHTKPVTAAKIMSMNPRHCIARPDVFQFPHIVVTPESVLYPGQVFYIIPNCTLHKLLNTKSEEQDNTTPTENHPLKHREDTSSSDRSKPCSPYLEAWPMMYANRNSYIEFKNESIGEDSRAEDSSLCSDENNRNKGGETTAVADHGNRNSAIKFQNQVDGLKSCLPKRGSIRTSRNQRVTFASPVMTHKNPDSRTFFP